MSFWRGLHFSRHQRPNLDVDIATRSTARAARDFFKDFDVFAPEISKFSLARRGLCSEWARATANVGTFVGCGRPRQLLETHVPLIRRSLA